MLDRAAINEVLAQAQSLAQAGQLDAAERLLDDLSKVAPDEPDVWLELGTFRLKRGLNEGASQALRQAVALNTADARAWNNLGVAEQHCGRLTEAQAAYECCLAIEPTHLGAACNLAYVLIR